MRNVISFILIASILPLASQAAILSTVSYAERTGTVQRNEIVEVWVTLTLDPLSDPLFIDHLAPAPNFGLSSGIVPTYGQVVSPEYDQTLVPFSDWEHVRGGLKYSPCGSSGNGFAGNCGSGNYSYIPSDYRRTDRFDWHTRYVDYPPAGYPNQTFLLNPGESMDFLVLGFQPNDGQANLGTFELYNVELTLLFAGGDAGGTYYNGNYSLGSTCESRGEDCWFTRTVVPIPGAALLFASALLGLARYRRP